MLRRYMRPRELADEFGVCLDSVRDMMRIIRRNIQQGGTRYSALDLIGSGKNVSIRTVAYMDAATHRAYINTDDEQYLPVYDPLEAEYELSLVDRAPEVDVNAITETIINKIVSNLTAV